MCEWRYSSTILDFGTRWRAVDSFTLWPLYARGKSSRYPMDKRHVGPKAGLDALVKRKISRPYSNRSAGRPISRASLSYPGSQKSKYEI
jgi:hypothetical protein